MGSMFGSFDPLYAAAAALAFAVWGTGPSPSIESTKVFSVVMLGSAGRSFLVLLSFMRLVGLAEDYLICCWSNMSLS